MGRYLNLAVKTRAQYHLCSVSCKESVNLIKVAKKLSKNISCEVTPHHLLLNCSMIDRDCGIYKVNPPLRNPEDQRALIRGIKNGTIDMIATDHAPHSEEEKLCKFVNSTFGIASLDFAFPLLYTKLGEKNVINLSKLIHLMSINPAKRFKLPSNEIAVKKIANFMIFDPNTLTEISKEMICSKSFISPYLGTKCRGCVKFNVVNVKIVYQGKK